MSTAWLRGVVAIAALAAGAGCGAGAESPRGDEGAAVQAIGASFGNASPYCAETTNWGAWEQTTLATWDDDVEPAIRWVIGTTGLHCGTYNGHHPSIGRAADWRPRSREEGTRFANWLMANARAPGNPLGIWYVIWQGQIYNQADPASGVTQMEDRGSFTQNHCDHVHLSFMSDGPVRVDPSRAVAWNPTAGTAEWAARYVAQSFPLASAGALTLRAGERVAAYIELRNAGTRAWDARTRLATTQPRDRASAFASSDWLAPDRPAGVTGMVAPGATYRFAFTLQAPSQPGTYNEFFGVVTDEVAWFSDPAQGGPPDNQLQATIVVLPSARLDAGADPAAPDAGADPAAPDAGAPGDARAAQDGKLGPRESAAPSCSVPTAPGRGPRSARAGLALAALALAVRARRSGRRRRDTDSRRRGECR